MDQKVRNLLYREPRLYDLMFPDVNGTVLKMCREAFARYLPAQPGSVLDIGCGTGLHLARLAESVNDCWGVDIQESMISYARAQWSHLNFRVGDMREVRLGRSFDVITCFGNAISYALSDEDLDRTIETFAVHSHVDTLLILDLLNARSYLDGLGFQERIESEVSCPEFSAKVVSVHSLNRPSSRLTRIRTWYVQGQDPIEDFAEYRLLFPEEVSRLLARDGFETVGMFDNREFRDSDLIGGDRTAEISGLKGRKLYVFALHRT